MGTCSMLGLYTVPTARELPNTNSLRWLSAFTACPDRGCIGQALAALLQLVLWQLTVAAGIAAEEQVQCIDGAIEVPLSQACLILPQYTDHLKSLSILHLGAGISHIACTPGKFPWSSKQAVNSPCKPSTLPHQSLLSQYLSGLCPLAVHHGSQVQTPFLT